MKLYTSKNDKITPIPNETFGLEKEIQNLVEKNLFELFNLELVKSEFPLKKYRLDTLCFDKENKSFVIIEYKRDKNFSVIDQGYSYLSLMLNNKSDFILEYNENCSDSLKRTDIDWTQSRVIFVSPKFTEFQKDSVNFKDVPFELWEIRKFENSIIGFQQYKSDSKESITTTVKDNGKNPVSSVSKEVKVYSEEDHINQTKVQEFVKEIYYDLKNRILNLGDDVAIGLGESPEKIRFITLMVMIPMCAAAVAVGKNIAFVGLIVPQIVRKLLGEADQFTSIEEFAEDMEQLGVKTAVMEIRQDFILTEKQKTILEKFAFTLKGIKPAEM